MRCEIMYIWSDHFHFQVPAKLPRSRLELLESGRYEGILSPTHCWYIWYSNLHRQVRQARCRLSHCVRIRSSPNGYVLFSLVCCGRCQVAESIFFFFVLRYPARISCPTIWLSSRVSLLVWRCVLWLIDFCLVIHCTHWTVDSLVPSALFAWNSNFRQAGSAAHRNRPTFGQQKVILETHTVICKLETQLTLSFRQSYDVTIDLRVEGSGLTSSNTLDLKNPYFRYAGQPAQPPPGHSSASPSETYWAQLDVQGARQGKCDPFSRTSTLQWWNTTCIC